MTALWVVLSAAVLVALVVYLIRRRPRVLPDSDARDDYPYMIEAPPRGVPTARQPAPDEEGDGDDAGSNGA